MGSFIFCLIMILTAGCLLGGCVISEQVRPRRGYNPSIKTRRLEENILFVCETGIGFDNITRSMYAIKKDYCNTMIGKYYKALLQNKLIYHYDAKQTEFARCTTIKGKIHITINAEYKSVDYYMQFLLITAATAAFAVIHSSKSEQAEKVFFSVIDGYDDGRIESFKKTQWYQNRKIFVRGDALILYVEQIQAISQSLNTMLPLPGR